MVEPVEIEVPLIRFEGAPCELGDPYDIDVRGLHEREILLPARLGPLFRVPCCAQGERDPGRVQR